MVLGTVPNAPPTCPEPSQSAELVRGRLKLEEGCPPVAAASAKNAPQHRPAPQPCSDIALASCSAAVSSATSARAPCCAAYVWLQLRIRGLQTRPLRGSSSSVGFASAMPPLLSPLLLLRLRATNRPSRSLSHAVTHAGAQHCVDKPAVPLHAGAQVQLPRARTLKPWMSLDTVLLARLWLNTRRSASCSAPCKRKFPPQYTLTRFTQVWLHGDGVVTPGRP